VPQNHDSTSRFNQLGSLPKLVTFPKKARNQSMTLKTLDSRQILVLLLEFFLPVFFFLGGGVLESYHPYITSTRSVANIFKLGKLPTDLGLLEDL